MTSDSVPWSRLGREASRRLGGAAPGGGAPPPPPRAVALDVDEAARPLPQLLREHQVEQMLKGREALAFAADERAEGLPLGLVCADDIEARRLARRGPA